jgi:hypothetical protein
MTFFQKNAASMNNLHTIAIFYEDKMFQFVTIFVILLFLIHLYLLIFTRFEKTISIDSNLAYSSGSGKYLTITNMVGDKEGHVYKVRNVLLLGKFRAAEIQSMLKPGSSYTVKGYGVRIPFLGMYPIIYEVKK